MKERKRRPRNCVNFWPRNSRSGNCPMPSCSPGKFRALRSENSARWRCANSLSIGSGRAEWRRLQPAGFDLRKHENPQTEACATKTAALRWNSLLGAVAGVDMDVFLGEIAGPHARGAVAVVQIDDNRDIFFEQAAVRGALVQRQRDRVRRTLWRTIHFHSAEPDFRMVGVEWDTRAAGGG